MTLEELNKLALEYSTTKADQAFIELYIHLPSYIQAIQRKLNVSMGLTDFQLQDQAEQTLFKLISFLQTKPLTTQAKFTTIAYCSTRNNLVAKYKKESEHIAYSSIEFQKLESTSNTPDNFELSNNNIIYLSQLDLPQLMQEFAHLTYPKRKGRQSTGNQKYVDILLAFKKDGDLIPIAKSLNINMTTARTRIFEARKAVKRFIEEKYAAQGKKIEVDI